MFFGGFIPAGFGKQTNEKYSTLQKVVVTGKANNLKEGTNRLGVITYELGFDPKRSSSNEPTWKAYLDEMKLSGVQYLLTEKQSAELRGIFNISGVPEYLLIDKEGAIVDQGVHLRPSEEKRGAKLKNCSRNKFLSIKSL